MEIKVSRTVHVELERQKWTHMTWSEDYHVMVGERSIGMVGKYDATDDRSEYWLATSATEEMKGWRSDRTFQDRDACVAALVRFAAKHGVI